MHIWRRSLAYRLYVLLGLPVAVALVVALALRADPADGGSAAVVVAPVAGWLAGLLALQWTFLAEHEEEVTGGATAAGDAYARLALGPVDPSAGRATWSFTTRLFGAMTLMVVLLVGGGVLFATGRFDAVWQPLGAEGPGIPLVAAPGLALVLLLALALPRNLRRAQELSDGWLAPLGLEVTGLPSSLVLPDGGGVGHHVVGRTTLAGRRHGRDVEVVLGVTDAVVRLSGPVAPFQHVEEDGDVRAAGGAEGVLVRRRVRGGAVDERWLADLELAERLACEHAAAWPAAPSAPSSPATFVRPSWAPTS